MLSLTMLILFGILCATVGWTAHGTYMERKELDVTEFVCKDYQEQRHCHRHDTWCDCACRDTS